ncbi:hypothetical protein CDCA_CDCA11G3244 [Cyanidium caldarium]|uniref:EXPERA domain-containing protein n=1 Tax=Cyanidium caldarium TaxID=2771 RepID=A0AAV9IY56_CYACA|nr:hypothetical protein CDCA_CDCA11G3244 [Cyanidium caldarium]
MEALAYFVFFSTFPFVTVLVDLSTLGIPNWPPAQLPLLPRVLDWWTRTYDPLMARAPVWFRAMTTVEALLMPAYSVLALSALWRNSYPRTLLVPTVVFATVCVYSVALLAAENVFGLGRTLRDVTLLPWLLGYLPYVVVPVLWTARVTRAIHNGGKVRGASRIVATVSRRARKLTASDTPITPKPTTPNAHHSGRKSVSRDPARRLTPTPRVARLRMGEAEMRTPLTTRSGAAVKEMRKSTPRPR